MRQDDAGFDQFTMQPAIDLVQALAQRPEFKRGEDIIDRLQLEVAADARFEIKRDIQVAHDRRQFAAEEGHLAAFNQAVARPRFDLIQILVNGLQVAILLQQIGGSLLADSGHPRDIIRRVAFQSF